MKNRLALTIFALFLCLSSEIAFAAGLSPASNSRQTLPTLGQAEHPKKPDDRVRKRALREAAQKKAALSWGAQTGYAKKTELRNRWLIAHAQDLDRIFSFRPFLAENEHVLLPSVDSGRRAFKLETATTSAGTLVSYRIREPARLVSIPPTFRDYLVLSPGVPKKVAALLLPRNAKEKKRWKEWTDRGWKAGEKLSERAFRIGSRRLVRAIEGRIRFYELSLAGQIDRPDWARSPATDLRTGEVLEIGDTVLRITRPARFTSSDKWKPLEVREESP
ncbi:MAG: type IV secretion system DotC family protein [Nitrospirae bacterium]|nr:type IV secretion system DotC family protein [Nitrospirota bacterium]MCL5284230.1 type IV secretion system DotC family protein [Nitrospirota bacterium]